MKQTRYIALWLFLACVACAGAKTTHAATLTFSGNPGTDRYVTISVLASAVPGESLNAVSATIHFPSDLLTVQAVSKSSSILSIFPEEPAVSNTLGTISFAGVVPNPGFSGQDGNIITITFVQKAPGNGELTFTNPSILANDGAGTEILTAAPSKMLMLKYSPPSAVSYTPTKLPVRVTTEEKTSTTSSQTAIQSIERVTQERESNRIVQDQVYDDVRTIGIYIVGMVLCIIAVGLLLILIIYFYHLVRKYNHHTSSRIRALNAHTRYDFDILLDDLNEQVENLKRARGIRVLTPEEEAIIHVFESHVRAVEGDISNRIRDLDS